MKAYYVHHADTNNACTFGPFRTKALAVKDRTQTIAAYGYTRAKGFKRELYDETYGAVIRFTHAVYGTAVFTIDQDPG